MKTKRSKSKKSRRKWWNSLSPEEQSSYIEGIVHKKMQSRRDARVEGSVKDLVNNCKNCQHGVCGGCKELADYEDRRCTDYLSLK